MGDDNDWVPDSSMRRGPRGPRLDATGNRAASCLMSHGDPDMLLLRRDIQDHARTRRKSVTMSSMPEDERAELEDCWKALEIDGSLDVKQLIKAADLVLGAGSYSERNVRRAFGVLDVTHSGQVDWITFRAFMTANWNAGRNADDALWTENRKRGDDMLLVDGSMRLVDLIKAYRRRTLVERALKDAQGQLREMQQKRDNGIEDSRSSPATAPAAAAQGPAPGAPRQRRRSITYDPDDIASKLPMSRRPQAQSEKLPGGGAAPSRLRRAQAEALAAAGVETSLEKDWSPIEPFEDKDNDAGASLTSISTDQGQGQGGRLLPLIVSSSPTSPVESSGASRFSRAQASPLKPATPPGMNGPFSSSSIPSSSQPMGSSSQPQYSPSGTGPGQGTHSKPATRNGNRLDEYDSDPADTRLGAQQAPSAQMQAQQPSSLVGQTPTSAHPQPHEHSNDPRHNGQYGQSNTDKRSNQSRNGPRKADSSPQVGILAPIKHDISSGFGRLAKFFWKSAPDNAPEVHRNRLPKI